MTIVLRRYLGERSIMMRSGLFSIVAQVFFVLGVYVLSFGIEMEGSIHSITFLALLPVLALVSSLPISFGGWGLREGAFVYGLGLIGYSMEGAFLLSVQVGVVTMLAPMVYLFPYMLRRETRDFVLTGGKIAS